MTERHLFVPEVVQTSATDCGPAALKALLEGFNIPVSYGRLREACQTSVDGTSIDTIEEIAQQSGLLAQQLITPADFLLIEAANLLPALAITRLSSGALHFIVIWRTLGPFVQVMNPASGRQWLRRQALLDDLYIHSHPVPLESWRAWAGSDGFTQPLTMRLQALGVTAERSAQFVTAAQQDAGWLPLATLDAATRVVDSLVRSDALERGAEATNFIVQLTNAVLADPAGAHQHIPAPFWSVTAIPQQPETLLMRGAVLMVVRGVQPQPLTDETGAPTIAPEVAVALTEKEVNPLWEIVRLLRLDGLLAPALVALAAVLAAAGVTIEALLLRGLVQAGDQLFGAQQGPTALVVILVFGLLLILIDFTLADALSRMGRHLDLRLRMAFLAKIPRLSDRYFQSRLISDMTLRAHELAAIKELPQLAVQLLQLTVQVTLTTAGVIYFVPTMAPLAIFVMALALLPALLARPVLQEQDLRYRTHSGGLSRFYLDGLLGLTPLRTHSAEKAFQNAHAILLTEWFQAGRVLFTFNLWVRGAQLLLSTGSVIWILTSYLQQGGDPTNTLLLFYWTLNLPALGQSIADLLLQYPALRNRVLRVLEPLGTPEENAAPAASPPLPTRASAPITLDKVSVVVGGHTILREISLTVAAGEHVAIVGASGAGKSSLVGLLLGWHKPATGELLVDGYPLVNDRLEALRRQTVWVDPAVHLWNRTMMANLTYGNGSEQGVGDILHEANLYDLLQHLPDGLQTVLGEGGGLVSGGQGQRVRLGRGLLRAQVRLVILDEPFRGLDRPQRQELLAKARQHWRNATLLFISHDVGDTQDFDRVLVVEQGQVVEDATPAALAAQADSRYRHLLDAETAVRQGLWQSATWRRLWLKDGALSETPREAP
jgi:ATP-binding cassette subfamily B protein